MTVNGKNTSGIRLQLGESTWLVARKESFHPGPLFTVEQHSDGVGEFSSTLTLGLLASPWDDDHKAQEQTVLDNLIHALGQPVDTILDPDNSWWVAEHRIAGQAATVLTQLHKFNGDPSFRVNISCERDVPHTDGQPIFRVSVSMYSPHIHLCSRGIDRNSIVSFLQKVKEL